MSPQADRVQLGADCPYPGEVVRVARRRLGLGAQLRGTSLPVGEENRVPYGLGSAPAATGEDVERLVGLFVSTYRYR